MTYYNIACGYSSEVMPKYASMVTTTCRPGSDGGDERVVDLVVVSVLGHDSYGGDPAAAPVQVAVGVVSFAGSAVVVWTVDFDHYGAAVTKHDEVGGTHTRVAELCSRERHHRDGVLRGAFPLQVNEKLVDHQLGLAAERQAVLRRSVHCQDGLVGIGHPVVSGDPAVTAQGQRRGQDEALSQRISVLTEQTMSLPKHEIKLVSGIVFEGQRDGRSRAVARADWRIDRAARDELVDPESPSVWCQQAMGGGSNEISWV